ncbi:MAG: hypothetical protein RL217_1464 [Pseudomonadota bacterium]|jgi:UDP-N-acetylmuramate dehydrogenase
MMQTQVDLRALNTLALPARAQFFATFSSVAELQMHLHFAKEENLPIKILGGGSNILLAGDVHALILKSVDQSLTLEKEDAHHAWLKVGAGKSWHDWVLQSIHYGHGLENLALIPGTVGAAPVQNIGAYGVEVADFIAQVQGVRISTGKEESIAGKECLFAYRDSIFKGALAGDFIITAVVFCLPKVFSPNLSYGPLQGGVQITPDQLIAQVIAIRQSKLPDPKDWPNAGSFFKNPIISYEKLQELTQNFPHLPHYVHEDKVKLAAGWLIEQAGFKGQWHGNVRMHDKQALVLTSNGQASFAEVVALRDKVVAKVQEQFGVVLEAEPQIF